MLNFCFQKVVGNNRANEKIGAAVRVGGQGNVWAAPDLIDYDKRVEPAMFHLFGNNIICRYTRYCTRKEICFNFLMRAGISMWRTKLRSTTAST